MCCRQFSLNLEVELDSDPGTFGGSTTNRKCTDIFGFIITVLFFGAVFGLTIYCILNSDIEKLTNGYDDQGNICGKNNIKTDSIPFEGFGKNMERKKYILIFKVKNLLVKKCIPIRISEELMYAPNYCYLLEKIIPYYLVMLQYWKFVLLLWFGSGLSACDIFFAIYYEAWKPFIKYGFTVLMLLVLILIALLSFLHKIDFYMETWVLAIIAAVAFLLYVPWLFTPQMSLKFDTAFMLYKEAWVAVENFSYFWFLPFISSLVVAAFVVALIFCWILCQNFSYLDQITVDDVTRLGYVQYPIATVTGALGIYAFFLLYEIVKNCQCMIVGGYVSQWYFTPKNGELTKPIERTTLNLLKYHLGTICFGSLILPVVYVVRAVVNAIKGATSGHNKESVYTCSCRLLTETCLETGITCLDSFSRNGFIMTAMHGCSFCTGSIRAHKLLTHNSFNAAAIKSTGDSILVAFKFFSTFVITILTYALYVIFKYNITTFQDITSFICFAMLSSMFIDLGLSAFETVIDALFLCFCEDYLHNNGTSKPYNIPPNFAKFAEEANKYVDPVSWKDVADKWENGPKRLYV